MSVQIDIISGGPGEEEEEDVGMAFAFATLDGWMDAVDYLVEEGYISARLAKEAFERAATRTAWYMANPDDYEPKDWAPSSEDWDPEPYLDELEDRGDHELLAEAARHCGRTS